MNKYKIFTDSTADLSKEMADEWGVSVVPTEFTIAGQTYLEYPDCRELAPQEFYRMMRGGEMPKTSVINPTRFVQYFEPVVKEGCDILHIVFSSALTATMQNSRLAAAELKEKYPDSNIVVVDSLGASMGEGLMVYHAARLQQQGATLEEAAAWVEANREHICHWFTVDDLGHLRRGGRVTVAAAMLGSMLNVKPLLHISPAGKIEVADKIRGRKAALETLLEKIATTATAIAAQTVMISHADCIDDANYLAGEIERRFGVKQIFINYIGAVIGTHGGPGTLAVFFIGTER